MAFKAAVLWILSAGWTPVGAQATVVPNEVRQPGTQPGEVTLEAASKCDNCHGGYDPAVEPAHLWSGGPMAQAGRDPLFWATVAVAEQDFSGVGDLCIRCHSPDGWIGGRSTPTDGSALTAADADGVACDLCHALTNPDDSEHLGVQNAPFVANDGGNPPSGYSGGGMYVLYGQAAKLGPYSDPAARHQALKSVLHRSSAACGTCHDVSNPVVGDLAPNHGATRPLAPGTFSGVLGAAVEEKAAFNNHPFAYGVVERTYSEHVASALDDTAVDDYGDLPAELQRGSIQRAYLAAVAANPPTGDYVDGAPRFFTCQTCHMRPVRGKGCNKQNVLERDDLPMHDLTGGNTWIASAIQHLDAQGDLVLGGGLTASQRTAQDDAAARARTNLQDAARLDVLGDTVRVVNLTGHKLISGYPEGRRMWLRIRWLDAFGTEIRVDGGYGKMTVTHDGELLEVESILHLHGPRLRIYEVHAGVSQEWASRLVALGYDPLLPLSFDRRTGDVLTTLGALAASPPGTVAESFHFALNDTIVADNRIPPYGMDYDEAGTRNVRPVPEDQYGAPGSGGAYRYWDEVELAPPIGAATAEIDLCYQTTSWEYIQFLDLANDGSVAALADTGEHLLEAWLATGMSEPVVMTSATWTADTTPRKIRAAPRVRPPVRGL